MDRARERDIQRRVEATYDDARGLPRDAPAGAVARITAALAHGAPHGAPSRKPVGRSVVARPAHDLAPPLIAKRTPVHWEILSEERNASGETTSGAIELPDDLPVGTYALKLTTSSGGRRRTET